MRIPVLVRPHFCSEATQGTFRHEFITLKELRGPMLQPDDFPRVAKSSAQIHFSGLVEWREALVLTCYIQRRINAPRDVSAPGPSLRIPD